MSKKIIAIASVAAVLALCLFGSNLIGVFNTGTETATNSFSMVAYAADGSEIGFVGEDVEILTITDPEIRERLEAAARSKERTVEISFIGDTIKSVDIETPVLKGNVYCLDADGNPVAGNKFKVGYPENLTEDFVITATAHFLDGTTETKTITIPMK